MNKPLIQHLMNLKMGQSLVMEWPDNTRPEKDGYMGFKHYTFHMTPTPEGLKFTRVEKKPDDSDTTDFTTVEIVPRNDSTQRGHCDG